MRARLLTLALALMAGCGDDKTYLVVTATNGGPPLTLQSLDVRVTSGLSMPRVSFHRGASFTVPPDATFALQVEGTVPSGEITLDLAAIAVGGATAASATAKVTLKPKSTTRVSVSLGGGAADGGVADLPPADLAEVIPPDATVAPADLSASDDLASPPDDLTGTPLADLATPRDLAMPRDFAIPAPAAPTNLAATGGQAQVSLTWTASVGATSYTVRRGTSSGIYSTVATGVTTTSYTDVGLSSGVQYFFVVVAVNASGPSSNSNEATATPLFQRVDSTVFRTYASSNSSNGAVSAASCTTADFSCHAVDGVDIDLAHAWTSGLAAAPYLQVDSGNANWGKHIDHFTIVYSTTACSAGNLQIDYHPPGSTGWNPGGSFPCVAGVKTYLNVPLNQDSWGLSVRNNSIGTSLTIFEVLFWTTN